MSARKQKRSPKSPRRKAGSKAKRKLTFRLTVEAQDMAVIYTPDLTGDDYARGQFVFKSPHRPARRIVISKTGYYSHSAWMEDIQACKSPQEYARQFVLSMLDQGRRKPLPRDGVQLSLF